MSFKQIFAEMYKKGKIDDTTIIKMAAYQEELEDFIEECRELVKEGALNLNFLKKIKDIPKTLKGGIPTPANLAKMDPVQQQLSRVIGLAELAGVLGGGARGVDYLLDKRTAAQTQKQIDSTITDLMQDPQVKDYDRDLVERYFRSMVHFSPSIASDPVAAKSHLLGMLAWKDSGLMPSTIFSDMAKVEENLAKIKKDREHLLLGMAKEPIKSLTGDAAERLDEALKSMIAVAGDVNQINRAEYPNTNISSELLE
jgi:hypothetical protein